MGYTPSNKSEDANVWPFLGNGMKSEKQEKDLSGIYLHFCNRSKNLSLTIFAPKILTVCDFTHLSPPPSYECNNIDSQRHRFTDPPL